jgi:hypothetical protein
MIEWLIAAAIVVVPLTVFFVVEWNTGAGEARGPFRRSK